DRKSTRLNSSHVKISYAVFCLKKKKTDRTGRRAPAGGQVGPPPRAQGDAVAPAEPTAPEQRDDQQGRRRLHGEPPFGHGRVRWRESWTDAVSVLRRLGGAPCDAACRAGS